MTVEGAVYILANVVGMFLGSLAGNLLAETLRERRQHRAERQRARDGDN